MLDWRLPTPDRDEGSLRTVTLLRALRDLGFDVTFAPAFPDSWPPHTATLPRDAAALHALGVELAAGDPAECLPARVELVLLLGGVLLADRFLALARAGAPGALVVYDTLDLHFLRQFRQAKATGNARSLRRALHSKARELALARVADRTLVVSPVEEAVLRRECPDARICLVTVAHEVRADPLPFEARRDLLFVGNYESPPNVDAALHYLDAIHPLARAAVPGLHAFLLGGSPPAELTARSGADTVVTGHVPDLAPWLDRCRLSIAPLRFGAGVKGKVLRSLGQGVPVVATSVATEGLGLVDGRDALIADEPAAFAAAIAAVHDDAALWGRLSAGGRAVVARHFSFATVRAQLAAALAPVLAGGG